MGFSQKIKDDILVACARHCCVCHRYSGLNMEIHHIKPQFQGGKNTFANAIALCLDCHANAGHYNPKHPKGTKYSPSELRKHKKEWIKNVLANNIKPPINSDVRLEVIGTETTIYPLFIEEKTIYKDKSELAKISYKKVVEQMKTGNLAQDFLINKIRSFEDFVDHLNGDDMKPYLRIDVEKEITCQPIYYSFDSEKGIDTYINKSACTIQLALTNYSSEAIEDYKVYIKFKDIVRVDRIDKRREFFDQHNYEYNIQKDGVDSIIFLPKGSILVQRDFVKLDGICFTTTHKPATVKIEWRMVGRNYASNGEIDIIVEPAIEVKEKIRYVDKKENGPEKSVIKKKFEMT